MDLVIRVVDHEDHPGWRDHLSKDGCEVADSRPGLIVAGTWVDVAGGTAVPLASSERGPQAWTASTSGMRTVKSRGLRVKTGIPSASAVAAMSRSTARAPRALRLALITAA